MNEINTEETRKEEMTEETAAPEVEETETVTEEVCEPEGETEVKEEPAKKKGKKEKKQDKQQEEIDKLNDKYLRLYAEYDNFRKRSQKEKDSLYGEIKTNVVTSFLPVYDNLERALNQTTEDEAYKKGVEMIMNQFKDTLNKLGIEEIPAMGEKFDPAIHNAVMHVDDETKGENEIVEVFQKGFKLGDKIIRFSMVKVAN